MKKRCQGFGDKCGFGYSTGNDYGDCCSDEQDLHCIESPSFAPGAESTCRRKNRIFLFYESMF